MKTRTKVLLIALAVMTTLVLFAASSLRAGTSSNASGSMWSSNIGWISLNNCTDPADSSKCASAPDYGVNIDPATGAVSGTAWSSNIGWITFNDVGCPTSGCTGGASFNTANSTINGWARACSVFASGCSGALADNAYRGEWDGFLSLSGSGYGMTLGVLNGTTRAINGSIWGSEVIGWVAVQGDAKITIAPGICTNLPNGPYTAVPPGYTLQGDGVSCLPTNGDFCPNIPGSQDAAYVTAQNLRVDANGSCVPSGGCTDPSCVPPPICLNYHQYGQTIPSGWLRDPATGNCYKDVCTPDTPLCPDADLCPNISGKQDKSFMTIGGYVFDQYGNCVIPGGNYCPNTPYTHMLKTSLPSGWTVVNGQCVPPTNQCQAPYQAYARNNLPAGWTIDATTGNCVPPVNQFCPDGSAKPVTGICAGGKRCPNGSTPVNGVCGGGTGGDVCPNIVGVQLAAPAGYTINSSNQCVPIGYPDLTTDWCPNIPDVQLAIPGNMTVNPQGSCVAVKKPIFIEF